MKLEQAVLTGFLATLTVSAGMAHSRVTEERVRRTGLKGTHVVPDGCGREVEHVYTRPAGARDGGPVVVLESGLGVPLEGWDWVCDSLADDVAILRYHRRGYARTTSRLRPARLLEILLDHVHPTGPVLHVSHSLGALVTTNVLAESERVRERTAAVCGIEGTDAVLLEETRASSQQRGRFVQNMVQHAIGSVTGVNRWVPGPVERDVAYRPDVQRGYVTTSLAVPTLVTATREYFTEPTAGQAAMPSYAIARRILAAADNVAQQRTLAQRWDAKFDVVPLSAHRSVIGRIECARIVAGAIREML